MFLLDTDTLSLYLRGPEVAPSLVQRIQATPPGELAISVITAEEVLRGALDLIRKDQRSPRVVQRYESFRLTLLGLQAFPLLPYNDAAEALFAAMPPEVKRIGTQDCRIAAVALAHGRTVITRNAQDFSRIPGVAHEDWT